MTDLVERLRDRAKRMNGTLVGASDGGTYAVGYYDQFCASDSKDAADYIETVEAENVRLVTELRQMISELRKKGPTRHPMCHRDVLADEIEAILIREVGR